MRRWTAAAAATAMVLTACTGDDPEGSSDEPTAGNGSTAGGSSTGTFGSSESPASFAAAASGATLGFTLGEGNSIEITTAGPEVIVGAPLDDAATAAVLDRLPDWDVEPDDVSDFARPVDSLQPPVVGDTVEQPFPASGAADASSPADVETDGLLEVLRFQPDGDVDAAPFVAITFDEPMIPLATLDALDASEVPVTITPDITATAGIDGRWRWIGTRTLRFEVTPESTGEGDGTTVEGNAGLDRLPAATDYTVTVPAGTESATGSVLDDEVSFTFSTPAPTITSITGVFDSMTLDPVFVATFDQRVDPAAVVDQINIEADGEVGARLATDAEVAADPNASAAIGRALADRAVAFVPTASLPADTSVTVTVGPDVPSLEGPRTSTSTASESGRTYGPFEVVRSECFDDCPPLTPLLVDFSNELDGDAFDPSLISVSPALPGLRVDNFGRSLQLRGATAGNTTYTVTLDGGLLDRFGQSLGESETLEWEVGDPRPLFVGPNQQFVTADPFVDEPTLSVTSIGHEQIAVTAWQVDPAEYADFERFLETTYSDTLPDDPDWPIVLESTIDVEGDVDALVETSIDLSEAFDGAGGNIVVRAQPDPLPDPESDDWWQNRPTYTWVQDTDLGVDVFVVDDELLVWVTDLTTGAPVADASIRTIGTATDTARSDAGGVARFDLDGGNVVAIEVDAGDRSTTRPSGRFDGWQGFDRSDDVRVFVTDDRGVYRPGETVRMTGLVRDVPAEDAQLADPSATSVRWAAFDAQGNEIGTGDADINGVGGFNLSIELPEAANTGQAFVQLELPTGSDTGGFGGFASHDFLIADFRTPEFEVDARNESAPPYYVVDPATIAVDAEYFAGGPLADAEVSWQVSARDTSYSPPGWDEFAFGVWTPWWFGGGRGDIGVDDDFFIDECFDCFPTEEPRFQQYLGRTDAAGTHRLQIDFTDIPASTDDDTSDRVDQPTGIVAEATVFDVNRQAISSRIDLVVHPAQYYVGLRSDRGFVERGDPIVIDSTVVDVDGTAVAGREFVVTAGRLDATFEDGRYVEEIVDEETCTITSTDTVANAEPDSSMRCEFDTEVGGQYRITAIVTDDDGRTNRAVYTQYVSGGRGVPARGVERDELVIIPDAEFHAPGDTAELLVQAPFAPASGLVTVTRAGIETVQTFDAPDGSAVIEIPIADDDIPNLNVRVDMVGTDVRLADDGSELIDGPPRPAFAVGQTTLQIPPTSRTLTVDAEPADEQVVPGSSTAVTVSVRDADGAAVAGAGVALIVVDEAVLSLSGYELPDPLDEFYRPVFSSLDADLIRDSIVLSNPEVFDTGGAVAAGGDEDVADDGAFEVAESEEAMEESAEEAPASTSADQSRASSDGSAPIDVREDFDALAVFAPDETTGADGSVTVDIDLPDNLTRYRVMAIAASGADRFGSDESAITAALPISVRPSAPRFLNFGDVFELPVVVQNRTDAPVEVDVAIETANLSLTEGAGRRVTVPANDRVEVRFSAAAESAGTARFRVATVSGEFADAAEVALPVYTPATSEAFATYGVVDGDEALAQPLLAPVGVIPQFGGLEISTSSTALQALTDSVLYLYEYRYDSADGYASRIMAVAALRDVLDAFDSDGLPDPDRLDAEVQEDIADLEALQNDDGGFPYWQRGRPTIPYVTVQATHALLLARDAGYDVDVSTLDFAIDALRRIDEFIPAEYSQSVRDSITAYALYVLALAGESDPSAALSLYRSSDLLDLESIARLWPVIDDPEARDEIEDLIDDATIETASSATFATSYGEDAYLIAHSDRRTDGVVLGALVSETPESDLIPKVVAGLLGNQTQGRWNNAQENAFILLALNDYFDTFESIDPDFVARAWLGDLYAVESEFRGRSIDTDLTIVPTQELIDAGDVDLVLDKDGAGRLYYRFGLRYAPSDLDLDPRDEGFVVERRYEAVDDPNDVVRNDDGSWSIAAGATVRVTVTMVADARRTHVALIDPLPAGFEPVNPAFATSLTVPPSDPSVTRTGSWYRGWFEHQNLRDDRAEAFTSFLPGGTYTYTYVARATTPGDFVVPPARAEEIFAPEVFGRSSSERVTIS